MPGIPQIHGVVTTLTFAGAQCRVNLGVTIEFLSPEGFPIVAVADLSGILRLALRQTAGDRATLERPADAIHNRTEGPIGYMVRAHCIGTVCLSPPPTTRLGCPNTFRSAACCGACRGVYARYALSHAAAATTKKETCVSRRR